MLSDWRLTFLDILNLHGLSNHAKETKLFIRFQVVADEFSHTVLHRQPFVVPVQKAAKGKPVKPTAGKLYVIRVYL